MPTYEYKCRACDHQFETVQKMSDDPLRECPECGGELKRLIGTGAGIIFKGSGFYQTDYRSENYKKDAAKDKKPASSSSSSKSETTKKSEPAKAAATT